MYDDNAITPSGGITKNQFKMPSNIIAKDYSKNSYEVDADPSTLTISSVATIVNWYVLPPYITGRNGIVKDDVDLCTPDNDMVGCYEYNRRGSSTYQGIG